MLQKPKTTLPVFLSPWIDRRVYALSLGVGVSHSPAEEGYRMKEGQGVVA